MIISLILLTIVTTILYLIISFVLGLLFTSLSLLIPFLLFFAKIIGVLIGAVAFGIAFFLASLIFGNKIMGNIIKIIVIAFIVNGVFSILGWILTPLAGLLKYLFPLVCILVIKEMID